LFDREAIDELETESEIHQSMYAVIGRSLTIQQNARSRQILSSKTKPKAPIAKMSARTIRVSLFILNAM